MRSPVDLAATALHEAGHATAELVLRPKRTFVAEIYPDPKGRFAGQVRHPDSPGDCEHDVEVEESSRLFVPDFAADHDKADEIDGYLIRSGVTYYAGCAAQLFDSRGLTAELVRCSYYDRMRVSDAALGMGRDLQPGQFWWRAFDRACDLIDAEWGAVVAIATVLEQRLSLTSDECAAIRAAAAPLENFWRGPKWNHSPDDPLPLLPDLYERIRYAASPSAFGGNEGPKR